MVKAELYDLGRYNGMAEPDPSGSYHGLEIRDPNTREVQTFLIAAHQLPSNHTQAEKKAAARIRADAEVIKAAEALADALCAEEETAGQDVWAKLDACEITDNALADFRQAQQARAARAALEEKKDDK